ncbi:MAG: hypothetical protein L6R39_006062 [Caloplaca ligustica]|nr:MAG: hypothetical protein L6R39_006062 [Caloplaca ligustica]
MKLAPNTSSSHPQHLHPLTTAPFSQLNPNAKQPCHTTKTPTMNTPTQNPSSPINASSPASRSSTPTTEISFPYYIYTVHEALIDLIEFPTALIHLRGVFADSPTARNTAWNRIFRGNPGRDWAVPPAEIYMGGKEMYVVAVEADGCLLAVWVERREVRREAMVWMDIDGQGRGLLA